MKILRLTNSNDLLAGATPNRPQLLREKLEAHFGEPVELLIKTPWPNARMPAVVERWVEREQPDVVWLGIVNYWVAYPSFPLLLERKLGPVGRRLARLGFKAAENPLVGPSRPFRAVRYLLLRTIGGSWHFEPEEIVARVEETARRILQHEGILLVLWGPHGWTEWAVSPRQRRQAREQQARLVRGLTELSQRLHIPYDASERPHHQDGASPEFAADHFHYAESFGTESAEAQFQFLREAIEASRT